MKVFLHIGIEKTGSTSIQHFISKNKTELSKQIYIPNLGFNHWPLAVLAYDDKKLDSFKIMNDLLDEAKFIRYKNDLFDKLKQELAGKSKVLFSSELIHSRLTSFDEVKRLKDVLLKLGASKIKIIVYLREQGDLINSLYQEAIRWGEIDDGFSFDFNDDFSLEFKDGYKKNISHFKFICDHLNTLKTYEEVFGKQSLCACVFDKQYFKDGDLITDFLSKIEVEGEFLKMQNSNESLDVYGMDLLLYLNKNLAFFVDNKQNPLRADLNKYINKHFTKSENKFKLDEKIIKMTRDYYKLDNEIVFKRYFNNLQSFSYKDYKEHSNAHLDENVKAFMLDFIQNKNQIIAQLKQDINYLKNNPNTTKIIEFLLKSTKAYKLGFTLQRFYKNKFRIDFLLRFVIVYLFYKDNDLLYEFIHQNKQSIQNQNLYENYLQGLKLLNKTQINKSLITPP